MDWPDLLLPKETFVCFFIKRSTIIETKKKKKNVSFGNNKSGPSIQRKHKEIRNN